jgi:hypothetical protein
LAAYALSEKPEGEKADFHEVGPGRFAAARNKFKNYTRKVGNECETV